MGTSSSHRSPSTPQWERVKELYRRPRPDPRQVVARITQALDKPTRQAMAGPGVACCLHSLLQASREIAEQGLGALVREPERAPLVSLSEVIRQRAERRIAEGGMASLFSELGLNALATAVFEAGAGGAAEIFTVPAEQVETALASFSREQRLHQLSLIYLAHDFDHMYRYFVMRDTPDFVGTEELPTIAEASQLHDAIARYCRERLRELEAAAYEERLAAALRLREVEAWASVQEVLVQLMDQGMQRLAASG